LGERLMRRLATLQRFNLSRLSKHQVIEVPMRCEQSAGVKHPRLHGVLRKVKDLGDLFDRLLVVVNEVNDFAVVRRHLGNTAAQLRASVGVEDRLFGSIGIVRDRLYRVLIELGLSPLSKRGKGLKSRYRKYPGGDLRTIFEGTGLAPNAEEDLTDKILRAIGVRPKTDDEVVNAKVMPSIQRPHGGLAARRNRSDKIFVGVPVVRMHGAASGGVLDYHFPLAAPQDRRPRLTTGKMQAGSSGDEISTLRHHPSSYFPQRLLRTLVLQKTSTRPEPCR
jgi:hypothetical protein